MIIIMDIMVMDIIIVINIFLHMATRIAYQMEMPILLEEETQLWKLTQRNIPTLHAAM